ncbi:hypothetical protein Esti_002259 [Eimeria stiedai]
MKAAPRRSLLEGPQGPTSRHARKGPLGAQQRRSCHLDERWRFLFLLLLLLLQLLETRAARRTVGPCLREGHLRPLAHKCGSSRRGPLRGPLKVPLRSDQAGGLIPAFLSPCLGESTAAGGGALLASSFVARASLPHFEGPPHQALSTHAAVQLFSSGGGWGSTHRVRGYPGAPLEHSVVRERKRSPLLSGSGLAAGLAACSSNGSSRGGDTEAGGAAAGGLCGAAAAAACGLHPAAIRNADVWIDSLCIVEMIPKQGESPLATRPLPPRTWELLRGGKLLKRLVVAGEGEDRPTLSCNATLDVSVYKLWGLKLLDNKTMHADFFEIPVANAACGIREALLTMRQNERAVYLVHPSLVFPSDYLFSFPWNTTAAAREAHAGASRGGSEAEPPQDSALKHYQSLHQQERERALREKLEVLQRQHRDLTQQIQHSETVSLTGRDWLMLDLTLCSFYERDSRWWSLGPDSQLSEQFPPEVLPEGQSPRDAVEVKTEMLKQAIHDEMAANPQSPLWEDIEANMTRAHREQQAEYVANMHGLDLPEDPSTHGSRGFLAARSKQQINAGGYEEGPRMDGLSSVYGWRETPHAFELVVLIRPGLRRQHFTWSLSPRAFKLQVGNAPVLHDTFLYSIDTDAGATWTLTEAAAAHKPLSKAEIAEALEAAAVEQSPTAASPSAAGVPTACKGPVSHPHTGLPVPRGFASKTLLREVPQKAQGLEDLKRLPALIFTLPKARSARGMWGSCFVSV